MLGGLLGWGVESVGEGCGVHVNIYPTGPKTLITGSRVWGLGSEDPNKGL